MLTARFAARCNSTMQSEVDRNTAQALALLSPTQIVALVAGSLGMG